MPTMRMPEEVPHFLLGPEEEIHVLQGGSGSAGGEWSRRTPWGSMPIWCCARFLELRHNQAAEQGGVARSGMVSLSRFGPTHLSQSSSIGRETSQLRLWGLWGNLWVPQIGNEGNWWERNSPRNYSHTHENIDTNALWGARGRQFKSARPDHRTPVFAIVCHSSRRDSLWTLVVLWGFCSYRIDYR